MDGGQGPATCVFYASSGSSWVNPAVTLGGIFLTGFVTWWVTVAHRDRDRLVEAWATFLGLASKQVDSLRYFSHAEFQRQLRGITGYEENYEKRRTLVLETQMEFRIARQRIAIVEEDDALVGEAGVLFEEIASNKHYRKLEDIDTGCDALQSRVGELAKSVRRTVTRHGLGG